MARNDFTASDDDHLIEYIAQQNPDSRGRMGNNLYKNLEENIGNRWPWSGNHTWQSWRERYKKNHPWFDYHVKKHLKKRQKLARDLRKEEEEGEGEEQADQRTNNRSDTKLKSKPKPTSVKEEQPKIKVEKPKTELDSVVARHDEVVTKPFKAAAGLSEEPQFKTALRADRVKNIPSKPQAKVREEPHRATSVKASHMEEIPDSEGISPEATGDSDDLMLELFGPSDGEEEPQQPKSPSKVPALNGSPSAPKPSFSSEHFSQLFPLRSSGSTSQHPSQGPTPPKSNAEQSAIEESQPPSPSYLYRRWTPPEPGQRQRPRKSSPTPPPKKAKPKPKKKPERNIFESSSPTPPPPIMNVNDAAQKEFVFVVEGPPQPSLKRPRQVQRDSDSDEGRKWPPKRSKTNAVNDEVTKSIQARNQDVDLAMNLPLEQSVFLPAPNFRFVPAVIAQSSNQASQQKSQQPRQRPESRPVQQQVNAVASSSKVKLPDKILARDSKPFISEQHQRQEEERVPAPALTPARTSGAENGPSGDDTIAGHKAPIPVRAGHDLGQVQGRSKVEVYNRTTTTAAITITNAKDKDKSQDHAKERRKVDQGKLHSITHEHTRPVENGRHPEGVIFAVNRDGPSNGASIANPNLVPAPTSVSTTDAPPSAPVVLNVAQPAAIPAAKVFPTGGVTKGNGHALPSKPVQANDPFISTSTNATPKPKVQRTAAVPETDTDKFKARASDQPQQGGNEQPEHERAYALEPKPPRKIDLHRQSFAKAKTKHSRASASLSSSVNRPNSALSRRESLLSTHSRSSTTTTTASSANSLNLIKAKLSKFKSGLSSSTASRRRSSMLSIAQLDPDERPKFAEVAAMEISEVLQDLADTYGVSAKIAMKTYINTGNLQYTEAVLQNFYTNLAAAEKDVYARLPELLKVNRRNEEDDHADEEEEIPEGLLPDSHRSSPSKEPRENERTPQRQPRPSGSASASPKRPRTSMMSIKPLLAVDEDLPLSDYSPPNSSRAGQFARLTKQGRKEEALEREKRRASGIHISSTQAEAPSEMHEGERRSSPPPGYALEDRAEDASPSPHDRRMDSVAMQTEPALEVHRNEAEPAVPVQSMYMQSDDDDMYAHTDDEFAQQMGAGVGDDEDEVVVEAEGKSSPIKDRPVESANEGVREDRMDISPLRMNSEPEAPPPRDIHEVIDELENANPKLAKRHRALAFNVTQENVDKMREFEAANDQKELMLLSIKWAKEFLRDHVAIGKNSGSPE